MGSNLGQEQGLGQGRLSHRKWAPVLPSTLCLAWDLEGFLYWGWPGLLLESVGTGAQRQKEDAWISDLSTRESPLLSKG